MSDPMTPETPDPPPVSPDPWKDIRGDVTYTVAEIATWQDVRLHDMTRAPKCWSSTERSFACQIDFLLRARAADALRHQQFRDAVASALCVENPDGPVSEEAIMSDRAHGPQAERQVIAEADTAIAEAEALLETAERRKADRRAFDKLECPYCKSMQSSVVDCRPGTTAGGFWRRRKCHGCGRRFVTEEVVRGRYDTPGN